MAWSAFWIVRRCFRLQHFRSFCACAFAAAHVRRCFLGACHIFSNFVRLRVPQCKFFLYLFSCGVGSIVNYFVHVHMVRCALWSVARCFLVARATFLIIFCVHVAPCAFWIAWGCFLVAPAPFSIITHVRLAWRTKEDFSWCSQRSQ